MDWTTILMENWHVKLVCVILIVAAYIDGKELRVPNWITYPMVFSGLIYCTWMSGWSGLGAGILGMFVGLACLLPLYSVGGMGAGDVKLMAGVGAWLGWKTTVFAFAVSTVVGAIMAVIMVLYRGNIMKHTINVMVIWNEWKTEKVSDLSKIAAERKPTMMLLPYGIPICIGSIAYFFYEGMI